MPKREKNVICPHGFAEWNDSLCPICTNLRNKRKGETNELSYKTQKVLSASPNPHKDKKTYVLHEKWRYLAYDGTFFLSAENPIWNSQHEYFEAHCEIHELNELFHPDSLPYMPLPEASYGLVWKRNFETDRWTRIKESTQDLE